MQILNFLKRSLEEKVISSLGTSIKMKNITMMLRKIVNHPYLVKWDVDVETGLLFLQFNKFCDFFKIF